jgi:hypothetical protein
LITRIRQFLHAYYNYQVFHEEHPDLKLCDTPDPSMHIYYLCLTGLTLMIGDNLVGRLIREAPEIIDVIFNIDDTHRKCTQLYEAYRDSHMKRPPMKERRKRVAWLITLQCYRPTYELNYLLAPIWSRLQNNVDSLPPKFAKLALTKLLSSGNGLSAILSGGILRETVIASLGMETHHHNPDRFGANSWFDHWVTYGGMPSLLAGAVSQLLSICIDSLLTGISCLARTCQWGRDTCS